MSSDRGRALRAALAALLVVVLAGQASAEDAVARLFSRAFAKAEGACAVLTLNFTTRVRYTSHFPPERGGDLRIRLFFVDRGVVATEEERATETTPVPEGLAHLIDQIMLEVETPDQGEVRLLLRGEPVYEVRQGDDASSIIVRFPAPAGAECVAAAPSGDKAAADGGDPEARRLIDEARKAMTAGDDGAAIRLLSRALRRPESAASPEAQELLAVARERKGQLAHAKAEYEAYLEKYPEGEAADRVRQRLAALLTRGGPKRRTDLAGGETPKDEAGLKISYGGSVSQQYLVDNSTRTIQDEFFGTQKESDVNQNEVQSYADVYVDFEDGPTSGELRFSGGHVADFVEHTGEISVSELFAEARDKDIGASLRLGRQTRNSGGALGRFDGALATVKIDDGMELAAVAGLPVDRKQHPPRREAYFAGLSLEAKEVAPGLDATAYVIGQNAGGLTARRAVGLEARYFSGALSAFGAAEYDLHFGSLNTALVNGSYRFDGGASLNFSAERRNAPTLEIRNALQGQTATDLDELRQTFTDDEIKRLAEDRTAKITAGGIGLTVPLSENVQVAVDGSASRFSGTPASGGVAATPSTGWDFFTAARITGTSLLRPRDLYSATLRYSDTSSSRRYRAEARLRYPVTPDIRMSARLGGELRTGVARDFTEKRADLKLGVDYALTRDMFLEAEIGGAYSRRRDAAARSSSLDLYLFVGYRLNF